MNQDFQFIQDQRFKRILIRDFIEMHECLNAKAFKAVLVLSGSIIDDSGFVDPNSIGYILKEDDNAGPNNELGGIPYDYEAVIWSEIYPNLGYKVENGKPLPIKNY